MALFGGDSLGVPAVRLAGSEARSRPSEGVLQRVVERAAEGVLKGCLGGRRAEGRGALSSWTGVCAVLPMSVQSLEIVRTVVVGRVVNIIVQMKTHRDRSIQPEPFRMG